MNRRIVYNSGTTETVNLLPFPGARQEHAEKFGSYTIPPVYIDEIDGYCISENLTRWVRGSGDVVVDMSGMWANNYFHWVSEFLPKIQIADDIYGDYQIITKDVTAEFAKQSLELLGIHQDGKITTGKVVTIAKVPSRRNGGRMSVQAVKWLRSQFLTNKRHERRRLYISRNANQDKHVADEAALINGLGFEVVKPEMMTFREQVNLFSSADVIMGPHGAGLVNMIWAEAAHVIEILGDMTNPCHFTMAIACGHEYTPAYGKTSGRSIIINRKELEKCLALIGRGNNE
ncbi:MAG TPA: glycosyltransferase family 61 protein [Anaerolineales bacterium]|nr:glycosyltransferase family 61 protein [Anaerolineales bacterium]